MPFQLKQRKPRQKYIEGTSLQILATRQWAQRSSREENRQVSPSFLPGESLRLHR